MVKHRTRLENRVPTLDEKIKRGLRLIRKGIGNFERQSGDHGRLCDELAEVIYQLAQEQSRSTTSACIRRQ